MEIKSLKIGNLSAFPPVIQGGMGVGVSLSSLAGAVAKAGGIGILSTAQIGYQEPEFSTRPIETNLKAIGEQIKKARQIAPKGIIGVNIMVATQRYPEYVKASVDAGVDVIISGAGLPMELPELVKGSTTKIAPIVSGVKAAKLICKYWKKKYDRLPDFIVIEGPMAGGHLGFHMEELVQYQKDPKAYHSEISSVIDFIRELELIENVKIPVVVAGGIFTREDMLNMLALGADGVQIATRFVTTYECDAPQSFKDAYLNATKDSITITKSPVGMPGRVIQNEFIERVKKERIPIEHCRCCVSTCKKTETPYCITDALIRAVTDQTDEAVVFCGANAWKCSKMEHVADIMQEFK
ncbi:MAG: nitronate monooxygenase [Clostridia bacterium]|nr:nitronate monooxygenase [Clostridia bacterium]